MSLSRPAFKTLTLSAALAALCAAGGARAQSLVELYEAARGYDAAYTSARLAYDASLARAEQSFAGLLPSANLSGTASTNQFDATVGTAPGLTQIDRRFGVRNITLSASQPLYRPANLASYKQGQRSAEVSRAQLDAAEQDLIVRVSQAYFDVLAAQDSLTFVQAQKAAVSEQLAAAKRNFEVGTSTITDTREAQARYDLVLAQEIATENDLRVKRLALDQIVGRNGTAPRPLATPVRLPGVEPEDVSAWVQRADDNHPGVRQARLAVEVAQLETEKAQAGHKPTVDLTASYSGTRNPGGNTSTALNTKSELTTIGVTVNLPLFAGFATQNRIRETLALEDKARADLDAAQRSVAQGTRTAYFGVLSGLGQTRALEAAEASSQSALDANKLGYQVGVRINIDVLNAQSQLFQTKRDLAKARYDVLVGGLRLRQASGSLQPGDLSAINALLAP